MKHHAIGLIITLVIVGACKPPALEVRGGDDPAAVAGTPKPATDAATDTGTGSGTRRLPANEHEFTGTSELPAELCGTGAYVSIMSITPNPEIPLITGEAVVFRARVQYSLPASVSDTLGLAVWPANSPGGTLAETPFDEYVAIGPAETGCGTVDLELTTDALDEVGILVTVLSSSYDSNSNFVTYRFQNQPYILVTHLDPPMSQPVSRGGFAATVSLQWDMQNESASPLIYSISDYDFSIFSYPDVSTQPVGQATFTYEISGSSSCQAGATYLVIGFDRLDIGDTVYSSVLVWYPESATGGLVLTGAGNVSARPGGPVVYASFDALNCSPADQSYAVASDAAWLTVFSDSAYVYSGGYGYVDYEVDPTGLTPNTEMAGHISLTSLETGAVVEFTVTLSLGATYVPPTPYTVAAAAFSWNTAADEGSGTLAIGPTADEGGTPVTLPFSFTFYDSTHTDVMICTNGGLMFSQDETDCPYFGMSLPYATVAGIALNYGDLYLIDGASVRYAATGSSPNRKFIVSYNAVGLYSDAGASPSTFQIILSEGTQTFLVQYGSLSYVETAGTNFGDGAEATEWAPAGNSAVRVAR